MDCPSCFATFSPDQNEPRILIACGHSVCSECLNSKMTNQRSLPPGDSLIVVQKQLIEFTCPDCNVVSRAENLNQFPKNLALLNMVQSGISKKDEEPTSH